MNDEQQYLYDTSNVFPNEEMRLDIENENTYSVLERDEYKTFKKPFSPSIGYYKPVKTDEDGMII